MAGPVRTRASKRGTGDDAIVAAIARNWRFWAALPAAAVSVQVFNGSAAAPLAVVPRPIFPRGVCRRCGCTWTDPCPEGCAWTDASERLCTNCVTP